MSARRVVTRERHVKIKSSSVLVLMNESKDKVREVRSGIEIGNESNGFWYILAKKLQRAYGGCLADRRR